MKVNEKLNETIIGRWTMFDRVIIKCPMCGKLSKSWYQENVRNVKCPYCWNEIPVRANQEVVKEEHPEKSILSC